MRLLLAVLFSATLAKGIPLPVSYLVEYVSDEGQGGWCTPLPGGRMLTAAHLVGRGHARWTTTNGKSGTMTLQWKDDDRDLAMYLLDGNDDLPVLSIAKHLPESGEPVYARMYVYPGRHPSVVVGRYLNDDSQGGVQLDMYGVPGASGSGIINENGELIAVLSSGLNASQKDLPHESPHADLEFLTAFRPIVRAIPVAGTFPGPPKHTKKDDADKPAGE